MTAAGLVELAGGTAVSVALAVAPLALLFLVFQVLFLRLPIEEVVRILTGTLVAAAGLYLFLLGVGLAFLPFGRRVGEALATLSHPWAAVAIGFAVGFVTTWSEPSVRILADQVEDASGGSIPRRLVLLAVCTGVAVSVSVGLLRIAHDIPLQYLLVPGYALVLAVMALSEQSYVAIAVDAGGVATGPLANSFLLALALGAASVTGGDPLVQGLGLVALIALAPVLSVMALGLLIRWKALPRSSSS
jgi:hypothetical protein